MLISILIFHFYTFITCVCKIPRKCIFVAFGSFLLEINAINKSKMRTT